MVEQKLRTEEKEEEEEEEERSRSTYGAADGHTGFVSHLAG